MEESSKNSDKGAVTPENASLAEDGLENNDNTIWTSFEPTEVAADSSEGYERANSEVTPKQDSITSETCDEPPVLPVMTDDIVEKEQHKVHSMASSVSKKSADKTDLGYSEPISLPEEKVETAHDVPSGVALIEEGHPESKANDIAFNETSPVVGDDTVNKSPSEANLRKKMICLSISITILVALIVGLSVYFVQKPKKNIETKKASNVESPYNLVAVGNFEEFDGFVRIDSTFLADNPDQITYYLTLQVKKEDIPETNNDLSLLLMESPDATLQNTVARSYAIPDIFSRTFPFRLHAFFDPSVFQTALLVDDIESKMAMVIGSATLRVQTESKDDNKKGKDKKEDEASGKISDSFGNSMEVLSKPPVLVAELQGWQDYDVRGTIKIDYALELANGSTVWRPFLIFEGIHAPDSPGPYLYLTTRENQRPGRVMEGDIFIPIDGAEKTSFTLTGSFTQDLDELTADDLQNYAEGSFVVWCTPFKEYLGGGQIAVQDP